MLKIVAGVLVVLGACIAAIVALDARTQQAERPAESNQLALIHARLDRDLGAGNWQVVRQFPQRSVHGYTCVRLRYTVLSSKLAGDATFVFRPGDGPEKLPGMIMHFDGDTSIVNQALKPKSRE